MSSASPLCHEALLTLARKLEAAASDGDRDRVETTARRLLGALIDHIRAEKADLALLDPDQERELARGQQRVVDHLVPLAVDVQNADLSHWDGLARRLVAELSLQATDERRSGLAGANR
jgi:hypothetical protein